MSLPPIDLNKPVFQIFPQAKEAVKQGKCPLCHKKIKEAEFKTELEIKEYSISGLCQSCQDKLFD